MSIGSNQLERNITLKWMMFIFRQIAVRELFNLDWLTHEKSQFILKIQRITLQSTLIDLIPQHVSHFMIFINNKLKSIYKNVVWVSKSINYINKHSVSLRSHSKISVDSKLIMTFNNWMSLNNEIKLQRRKIRSICSI